MAVTVFPNDGQRHGGRFLPCFGARRNCPLAIPPPGSHTAPTFANPLGAPDGIGNAWSSRERGTQPRGQHLRHCTGFQLYLRNSIASCRVIALFVSCCVAVWPVLDAPSELFAHCHHPPAHMLCDRHGDSRLWNTFGLPSSVNAVALSPRPLPPSPAADHLSSPTPEAGRRSSDCPSLAKIPSDLLTMSPDGRTRRREEFEKISAILPMATP